MGSAPVFCEEERWQDHNTYRHDYPSNFDCTYEFETVRAEGSCYEVLLENPFGVEASANCRNDRLEIYDVINADQGMILETFDSNFV